MNQNIEKNENIPSEDNLIFLYGLGYQETNESLLNFISYNFNQISNHSIRKLKVYDWISSVKWLLHNFNSNNPHDFTSTICEIYFGDELEFYYFENLPKTLILLESLENFSDIEMVGDKTFEEVIFVSKEQAIINRERTRKRHDASNLEEFNTCSNEERSLIMRIYDEYLYAKDFIETEDTTGSNAKFRFIDTFVYRYISKEFNTDENRKLIERVCESFINLKNGNEITSVTDDDILDFISNEALKDNILIVTAYYLQYILMSLGFVGSTFTPFEVLKMSGEKADVIKRLLCAVTTQKWDSLNKKSNSYYKAVNSMYKFDEKVHGDKHIVLDHLATVRKLLMKGGFSKGLAILDEDVRNITDYVQPSFEKGKSM